MVLVLFFYTILGSFLCIIFIVYWKFIRPPKRLYDIFHRQGISCEPFIPLVGQLLDIRRASENDATMAYRMELVRKHGYVYVVGFGPSTILVVLEPDMLADVFGRSHAQDYRKPEDLDDLLKPLIGVQNLLISKGVEHERARKMLNPAFHFVKLQSMVPIMIDQTAKAINEILALPVQQQVIDLQTEFTALTFTIIASCAFGKGFETMANVKQNICQMYTELLAALQYRSVRLIDDIPIISQLPFWRKDIVDKGSRQISEFVNQIIADRRHNRSISLSSSEDILDRLLSAVDNEGRPFSDQEIKDQALTFVLAGHETTGNLMTWAMYVLMTNEKLLQVCRDEVDRVLPDGIDLTSEHLNELVVCEAILQETLRLYPPAPFVSRQCINEHYIGSEGHRQLRIPQGAEVLVNTYILHRREEYWPRANEFDYTRWMRDPLTGLKPKLAHPFCYLPFAAGPRNCIGQNFALLEGKIILAMLVQRCNLDLEPGQKIVPDIRLTMRPKYGLRARVTKRL